MLSSKVSSIVVVFHLLLISTVFSIPCPGTLLTDYSFERGFLSYANGGTYCRESSSALATGDIRFCTVGYTWDSTLINPYPSSSWQPDWVGPNGQTNLRTLSNNFSPAWVPSGEIDLVTAQFQSVSSGVWAVRLAGQRATGAISQDFNISLTNQPVQCTLRYGVASNRLSTTYGNYQAPYGVQLLQINSDNSLSLVYKDDSLVAPAYITGSGTQSEAQLSTEFVTSSTGKYRITIYSRENLVTLPGVQPAFIGAVIDDVCFTCVSVACNCCDQCTTECPPPPTCPAPPMCMPTGCGCEDDGCGAEAAEMLGEEHGVDPDSMILDTFGQLWSRY